MSGSVILDFPPDPIDGQVYGRWFWDQGQGAWQTFGGGGGGGDVNWPPINSILYGAYNGSWQPISTALAGYATEAWVTANFSGGGGGTPGPAGDTPFIGGNGNWWVGTTDTGVAAQGPQGTPGTPGTPGAQGTQGPPGTGVQFRGTVAGGAPGSIPDASPNDGDMWVDTVGGNAWIWNAGTSSWDDAGPFGGGIPDANADGLLYGRRNGAWESIIDDGSFP